ILDTRFSTLSSSQFLRNASPASAGPSTPPRSLPWQPPHVRSYVFLPRAACDAVYTPLQMPRDCGSAAAIRLDANTATEISTQYLVTLNGPIPIDRERSSGCLRYA